VNGTSGGSATYGSINTSGLYQAPTTVPSPAVIQISATSVQDSTKSGSTQLSVVLKITVAPLTPSVQLFHPEQFNATVQGVSNTAVTWAVNGIAGGNSNVGQISNTGLYTPPAVLPSPATVTVSAHSQADSTQSASTSAILVADTTALDVVSISPVSNATGVSSQTAVSVVFNEAINPSTIGPGSITLGEGKTTIPLQFSYNASSYTLTLTPLVLLDPLTVVTLSIAPQLQDLGGNSVASTYSSTFTTAGPTSISGTVTPPNGVSANSLSAIGFRGQKSTIDTTGAFTTSISAVGVTVISVPLPSEASGLMALAISSTGSSSGAVMPLATPLLSAQGSPLSSSRERVHFLEHQITASQTTASSSSSVVVDFQTTAEAILFLSPALYRPDTPGASAIAAVIATDSNTQALATALSLAWNEPHPLHDPNVASAYTTALTSILTSLINQPTTPAVSRTNSVPSQRSIATDITAQTSSPASTPTYQSIDVCCISASQFTASGSNYMSTVAVNGAGLTNVLGNAAGWVMRVVPLAPNFSSNQLQPINGNPSDPDSPGPLAGESNADQQPLTWIPGNSVLQYANLFGDVNSVASWLTGAFFSQSPAPNPQATVTVPQTQPAFYLVRYFSGGTADSNEIPLVSSSYNTSSPSAGGIYKGQQLWAGALVANYATNIAGLILAGQPDDTSTCLAQGIISDPAFAGSILNFSPQTAGNWDGLMQMASTLSSGFQDVVPNCIVDSGEQQAFEMALDVAGMSSGVGDVIDGVSEAAQIGTAAQMMAELFTRDSPVDTAYIQVGTPSPSSSVSVQVSPATLSLTVGENSSLAATALDSSQNPISQASFSWASSNQAIAQISGSGSTITVTGIAPGSATIIATAADGAQGGSTITVTARQVQNLPAPALLTPTNGATGISSNPTFSWSNVPGNAGYRIVLATSTNALPVSNSSSSCRTCAVNTVVTETSYVPSVSLASGVAYFWEVHALTPLSNPGYGTWSSIFSFTTASSGVIDPYRPYSDITPGQPTVTDVINAAKTYIGAQWGGYNCTGLVWAVSDSIGADYYETPAQVASAAGESISQIKTVLPDPGNPPSVPATPSGFPGYVVPSAAGTYGQWTTSVSTTSNGDLGWTSDVKIGDLVRIPASALAENVPHSFIVVGGDQQSGWEVIDDTAPSGAMNPVTISEHTFGSLSNNYYNNEFYKEVVNADLAYISYLVPSGSSSPTVSGVSPSPVPGSISNQQLTISGSNFVSGATLTYYDISNTSYPDRAANFISSGQLVDPAFNDANDTGTWKVQVVNPGGQTSTAFSFTVTSSSGGPNLIALGQTLNGTLAASAPVGHCNYGAPSDRYLLDLSGQSGATLVTIAASSSAFDSFVCVLDGSSNLIAQDDDSAGNLNSTTTVSLVPGQYFVEVSSFGASGAGPYTLSATVPTVAAAGSINLGARVNANLSSSAANGQCNGFAPADRWTFTLTASSTVTIDVASTAFDTFVCLLNASNGEMASDYDSGPGTNSRLIYSGLPVGTYYIEVSSSSPSHAGGAYTLSLQPGLPPGTPISLGSTQSGNLSSSAANGQCNGFAPADRWTFTLTASSTVTIDVASTAFDTFVCLLNASNGEMASDYDSGPGTNSRLIYSGLPVGTYYIEVSSSSPGNAGGAYTLSLQPGLPPGTPISLGSTQSGNLSSTAANGQCNGFAPADRWTFTLTASSTVTIDVASTAFDTYVCLLNSSNNVLSSDTDSGPGTNSRLIYSNLAAGTYYIEVSSSSPSYAGGAYTLSLQPGVPPGTPISLGSTQSGNLSTTAANGQCFGLIPADRWTFTLAASSTVTISVTSTAFDTYACLLNANNLPINSDDNSGGGTNSQIVTTLGAATYYIEVSAKSGGSGAYTINLQ
jgi:hypothetical protein